MKRVVVLTVFLALLPAATSQPFTATIVMYAGCGSQFLYGEKACGELFVSSDAMVTRWMEDVSGNVWYDWGTRQYTAGSHTFCAYMGQPIGLHIMKIRAVSVEDGTVVNAQCEYTVCCSSSVLWAHRPECSCEAAAFTSTADKREVTPGDDVTVTVTLTNSMASDCTKGMKAGHLEIDWGALGGKTSPLQKDVPVHPGETKAVLTETHLIPPVPEGEYQVVVSYSDQECTWSDYFTLMVELPVSGALTILSSPETVNVHEKGIIKLLIQNQSQKEATFILSVGAPAQIYLSPTEYTAILPQAGYREVLLTVVPEETGIYVIEIHLTSGGTSVGSASLSVSVERRVTGEVDIVYSAERVSLGESALFVLRVTNPGRYDTAYQLQAAGIDVLVPSIPELFVPESQSREVELLITPLNEGVHELTFRLEAEGRLMDSETASFTVEKEFPLLLVGGAAGGLAVIGAVYVLLRARVST